MPEIIACALRLLARREHGALELAEKLRLKGYDKSAINEVILYCQNLGLQSDARFIESFCRSRIRQGYGPIKIMQELEHKKVSKDLIMNQLNQENWEAYALQAWNKKYKNSHSKIPTEIIKQKRFLLYRGFPMEIINIIFKKNNQEVTL